MSSFEWGSFWKEKKSFHAITKMSTVFFASQIEKKYNLKPGDDILDYGCGPGFITEALAVKNISVTGLDINEFFIEACAEKYPSSSFIHITTDVAVNKKILHEQLKERKFDVVIFLGVAQYLTSINEVEEVIKMLQFYLKESGKIIVGDVIDESTSSFKDAFSLSFHYIKKGKIAAFIRFVFFYLFSNYRNISKEAKMLMVPEQSICKIAENNLLDYKKVDRLSIHPSRSTYVLSRKSSINATIMSRPGAIAYATGS
jgi:2-polyprenyl-3-methyl-5-hydroxy-6-metoxy-1,4-benzoquinol methylase